MRIYIHGTFRTDGGRMKMQKNTGRITEEAERSVECVDSSSATHVDHFDILTSLRSCARVLLPIFSVQDCAPGIPCSVEGKSPKKGVVPVPVLIQFERDDDYIAGVNANRCSGTVRLVALHAVDVNHPFLSVDLRDLALSPLVLAPDDPHLVVFADGYRPCLV